MVQDASSGARFPFQDITVVGTSGTYRDSVTVAAITSPSDPAANYGIGLALGHPGTFTVNVTASGHEDWTNTGIVTRNNLRCMFHSDTVIANLIPGRL